VPVTVAVIAKAPEPGRVKTRLCPPCTPDEAASIATAALLDTVEVVRATRCARRVLAHDGILEPRIHGDLELIPQRGADLADRLAALFDDLGGPALVIAMDTPQVTPGLLEHAIAQLDDGADAVLGPALDGGYWSIGLDRGDPDCFVGMPMHSPSTGVAQLERLHQRYLRVSLLPSLRDVDTFADALAVAAEVPDSRFARAVDAVHAADAHEEEAV
jgi:rSAM/selenodomain-associated transferase 1